MIDGCGMLHWAFIDDAGSLVLGPCSESAVERAEAPGGELRSELRLRGSGFHRVTYGAEGASLGHGIAPMSDSVRANRGAFWQAVRRTESLPRRRAATWAEVMSLLGHWSWIRCSAKPSIAIGGRVYSLVHDMEGLEGLREIPCAAFCELRAALLF